MAKMILQMVIFTLVLSIKSTHAFSSCEICEIPSFSAVIKSGCECVCQGKTSVLLQCNGFGKQNIKNIKLPSISKENVQSNEVTSVDPLHLLTELNIVKLKMANVVKILNDLSRAENLKVLTIRQLQYASEIWNRKELVFNITKLIRLEISDFNVGKFFTNAFSALVQLNTLALENLNLTRLPPELNNLKKLVQLSVKHNQLTLNGKLKLPRLEVLNADNSEIPKIPDIFFKECSALRIIDLYRNKIAKIGVGVFPESLTQLDLNRNENIIKSFPRSAFGSKLPPQLNLSGNKFLCSCETQWIKDNYDTLKNRTTFDTVQCQNGTRRTPFMQTEFCEYPTNTTTTTISTTFTPTDSTAPGSTVFDPSSESATSDSSTESTTSVSSSESTVSSSSKESTPTSNTTPNSETTTSTSTIFIPTTDIPENICFNEEFIERLSIAINEKPIEENSTGSTIPTFKWNVNDTSKQNKTVRVKEWILQNNSFLTFDIVNYAQGYYDYLFPDSNSDPVKIICIDLLDYDILGKNCLASRAPNGPSKQTMTSESSPNFTLVAIGSSVVLAFFAISAVYLVLTKVKKPSITPPRRPSIDSDNTYMSCQNQPEIEFLVTKFRIRSQEKLPAIDVPGYLTIIDSNQWNVNHIYESIGPGKFVPITSIFQILEEFSKHQIDEFLSDNKEQNKNRPKSYSMNDCTCTRKPETTLRKHHTMTNSLKKKLMPIETTKL